MENIAINLLISQHLIAQPVIYNGLLHASLTGEALYSQWRTEEAILHASLLVLSEVTPHTHLRPKAPKRGMR